MEDFSHVRTHAGSSFVPAPSARVMSASDIYIPPWAREREELAIQPCHELGVSTIACSGRTTEHRVCASTSSAALRVEQPAHPSPNVSAHAPRQPRLHTSLCEAFSFGLHSTDIYTPCPNGNGSRIVSSESPSHSVLAIAPGCDGRTGQDSGRSAPDGAPSREGQSQLVGVCGAKRRPYSRPTSEGASVDCRVCCSETQPFPAAYPGTVARR